MTKRTGKGLSIGAAMKGRMETSQVAEVPVVEAPAVEVEALEPFNTRLRAGLHRRLKLHAVSEGRKLQDVVNEALEEYLSKKES
ncbi:hypothetical protein [Deinococcus ruber]|uniref:ParG n=1 Tax=Deinococcus ruber TaxID=1848197 RepID=A0A918KXN9_9DEIO|nr:hypothetical protein [Deinococcus ruber]GGR41700.1 hypothetical protein GCM10008957_56850 [Deinococcus ruber]